MLTLELSSYLLEIPNDAYTKLSQLVVESQEYCKLIGLYSKLMGRQRYGLCGEE